MPFPWRRGMLYLLRDDLYIIMMLMRKIITITQKKIL